MSVDAAAKLEAQQQQDRFLDAITESLTTLPTKDLRSWEWLASVWGSLDGPIEDICGQASGYQDTGRLLLILAIWKITNMLESGEPLPVGITNRQHEKEVEKRFRAVWASLVPEKRPVVPHTMGSLAFGPVTKPKRGQTWKSRMEGKSQKEIARLKRQRRNIQRRYRAKLKSCKAAAAPGS